MLSQNTLEFLKNLVENNNREWFQANRKTYEIAKNDFEALAQNILTGIIQFQPEMMNTSIKNCIFRINRDIRFSADKSPYKKNMAAAFGVGGRNSGKIDYYFHLQPNGESFIGGGMYMPTPQQLAKFRQEIDYNAAELKNIIENPTFRNYYHEIWGERTKKAPKGFSEDHPEIELLKYKQLFFWHRYSDAEVTAPNFADEVIHGCQLLKPYLDFLNYLFCCSNLSRF